MGPGPADLLLSYRDALKREWDRRLRAELPASSLALPDVLIYRMDDTLRKLELFLSDAGTISWPANSPPPLSGLREACSCGRNPLLHYFIAGGEALRVILPTMDDDDRRRIEQAWQIVAQREIALLCAICRRYGIAADRNCGASDA